MSAASHKRRPRPSDPGRSETRLRSAAATAALAPPELTSANRRFGLADRISISIIGCLAAVLLFWNLTDTYLWQDEAFTAVLAVRMMKFGRPLSYDGVNLLTNDSFSAEDMSTVDQRAKDPQIALDYYRKRGDFRPDTSWTYQPWGQFVVAAIGIRLFGQTTLGARALFALAGLFTVLALYRLVRSYLGSTLMAALAGIMLSLNVYWILHNRQARYYSLSSLFLLLTVAAYLRWQRGARWGAAIFVFVAWCWFQMDYGTVWPAFGIFFADAFIAAFRKDRPNCWKPVAVGGLLAAAIVPFIFYYQLAERRSIQNYSWHTRFLGTFYNVSEYVVPVLVLLAALTLLAFRRKKLPSIEIRLVAICCAIIAASAFWAPTVAPDVFVRYVIMLAPLGALVAAWVFVRGLGSFAPQLAWLPAAVLIFTPWLNMPVYGLVSAPAWSKPGTGFRQELSRLDTDVFRHRQDPNRLVIEWLKQNAAPSDEILANYEDAPMFYYLPNPIRGGIPAFRVEDESKGPPRFAVIRQSVSFVHWPVFSREINRYEWAPVPVKAPDITWGNNPDPSGRMQDPAQAQNIIFLRRIEKPNR